MAEEALEGVFEAICKLFKIKNLKDYQKQSLCHLANGTDCFVSQPTGSGKSIIFQALPFFKHLKQSDSIDILESCKYSVMVVSPLVSLMKDQEAKLKKLGIKVYILQGDTDITGSNLSQVLEEVKKAHIIYCSPESVLVSYRELLKDKEFGSQLIGFAIDESHCIKKWGSSSDKSTAFRSRYAQLSELRSLVSQHTPMVAMTATATNETREFIINNLLLNSPELLVQTPERKNIKLSIVDIKSVDLELFLKPLVNEVIEKGYSTQRILIFCRQIIDTRKIFDIFDKPLESKYDNYKVRPYAKYHAKTDEVVKDHVLSQISIPDGTVRILISTIAFGMGVDCKGLYTIVHYGPSSCLEDYFQEAGRAGRDGKQSNAVIIKYSRSLSSSNITPPMKEYVQNTEMCRRQLLLREFNETQDNTIVKHNCCDICSKICDCMLCPQTELNWWELTNTTVQDEILEVQSLPEPISKELRSRLVEIRSGLINIKGHSGADLLSGFPEKSIDEVMLICHNDITIDEIYEKTTILNKDIIPHIIAEINEVMEMFQDSNLNDSITTYQHIVQNCFTSDESNSDDCSLPVDFHVNEKEFDSDEYE